MTSAILDGSLAVAGIIMAMMASLSSHAVPFDPAEMESQIG